MTVGFFRSRLQRLHRSRGPSRPGPSSAVESGAQGGVRATQQPALLAQCIPPVGYSCGGEPVDDRASRSVCQGGDLPVGDHGRGQPHQRRRSRQRRGGQPLLLPNSRPDPREWTGPAAEVPAATRDVIHQPPSQRAGGQGGGQAASPRPPPQQRCPGRREWLPYTLPACPDSPPQLPAVPPLPPSHRRGHREKGKRG